jgi:hypothetical protein
LQFLIIVYAVNGIIVKLYAEIVNICNVIHHSLYAGALTISIILFFLKPQHAGYDADDDTPISSIWEAKWFDHAALVGRFMAEDKIHSDQGSPDSQQC